jgi:hypothetical protein
MKENLIVEKSVETTVSTNQVGKPIQVFNFP